MAPAVLPGEYPEELFDGSGGERDVLGARIDSFTLAVENDGALSPGDPLSTPANPVSAADTEGGAKLEGVLVVVGGSGGVLATASAGLTPGGNVKPDEAGVDADSALDSIA